MSLFDDLSALGFVPCNALGEGDFELQDDGAGPYIRAWKSKKPCPMPKLVREPVRPEPAKP